MSLKSELSADRAKKIEENLPAMETDLAEMPKKIYEELLEPTFRLMHEYYPMQKNLKVEIWSVVRSAVKGFVIYSTTPILPGFATYSTTPILPKEEKFLPELLHTGPASEEEILKALCERADEFELKAYPNEERGDRATFVLILDD